MNGLVIQLIIWIIIRYVEETVKDAYRQFPKAQGDFFACLEKL